jgi:hypothetical protein
MARAQTTGKSTRSHCSHDFKGGKSQTRKPSIEETDPALLAVNQMRPAESRPPRFLQSWNPEPPQIVFGASDGQTAVRLHGDGEIEKVANGVPSRFRVDPVVYRDHSTGPAIFRRICNLLLSFVHFDDPRLYALVTIWVMGTYLHAAFSFYGYLFLHSKLPRSGKTRTLEVISHLAFEATQALNAPTTAAIRDMVADGRTVQLDTLERLKGKNAEVFHLMMELFDAGFRNGGTVAKMDRGGRGEPWRRVMLEVYAPYSLAAINRDSLSDTALDRAFVVEMRRKEIATEKRRYNFHDLEKECQPIREDLYFWALHDGAVIAKVYGSDDNEGHISALQLNDRAADIWKPILAIARVLGINVDELGALAQDMSMDPGAAEDRRKLAVLRGLLSHVKNGNVSGKTSDLEDLVKTTGLHDLLSSIGFEQKSHRLNGKPRRAWMLSETDLRAAIQQLQNRQPPVPPQTRDYSDYTGSARSRRMSARSGDDGPIEEPPYESGGPVN